MPEQILRDPTGREIGRIHTSGPDDILKTPDGAEVGRYNRTLNITKDVTGKLVGKGNLLTYLLR